MTPSKRWQLFLRLLLHDWENTHHQVLVFSSWHEVLLHKPTGCLLHEVSLHYNWSVRQRAVRPCC
jgi:hypothetical protein